MRLRVKEIAKQDLENERTGIFLSELHMKRAKTIEILATSS